MVQAMAPENSAVLTVRGLNVRYRTELGNVCAVNDVDFEVERNQVLGIAGESGCGKSTLIRALLRLLPNSASCNAAEVTYQGQDLFALSDRDFRRRILWQEISLVPQSAMNSMNPVYRVGDQIIEAITTHRSMTRRAAQTRVAELFDVVGLQADLMRHYPHEFSGGMRQRAMIAMALALDPGLIIMDEPTTGLDVLVQERVLRRLREIRESLASSIILITHDISVIAEMCDRVAIMYGGHIMEQAAAADLFQSPRHPYTLGLKNAFPSIRDLNAELISIPGFPPTLYDCVRECPFEPRCPFSSAQCSAQAPPSVTPSPGHQLRCFHADEAAQMRELAKKKTTWHC